MENEENKGASLGLSRSEKILIAVALLLIVGIVVFDAVTSSTAYPGKVTYVVSEDGTSQGAASEAEVSEDVAVRAAASGNTSIVSTDVVSGDATESSQVESTAESSPVASSQVDNAGLCININTATAEELEQLPGIGPVKAAAIIEYRETNGDFVSLEEIMEVKGIGEKTFEKIRDHITLS